MKCIRQGTTVKGVVFTRWIGRYPRQPNIWGLQIAHEWEEYEDQPIAARQRLFFQSTNIGMKRIYIVIARMRKAR